MRVMWACADIERGTMSSARWSQDTCDRQGIDARNADIASGAVDV
jgi:hypothetical protein